MAFGLKSDLLNKVNEAKEAAQDLATQKTLQLMSDMNLILGLLPDAGYDVGNMDIELGLTPKVTIGLKLGRGANEAKLKSILDKMDNTMLAAIVASLIQAGRLQQAVSVETLELKDVEVTLTGTPVVALKWKQKEPAKTAAA